MKLTLDEAMKKHKELWSWIADETEKRKQIVSKSDFFDEHSNYEIPHYCCYLCDFTFLDKPHRGYDNAKCSLCPVNWGSKKCTDIGTLFYNYRKAENYIEHARIAREISEMEIDPERRDMLETRSWMYRELEYIPNAHNLRHIIAKIIDYIWEALDICRDNISDFGEEDMSNVFIYIQRLIDLMPVSPVSTDTKNKTIWDTASDEDTSTDNGTAFFKNKRYPNLLLSVSEEGEQIIDTTDIKIIDIDCSGYSKRIPQNVKTVIREVINTTYPVNGFYTPREYRVYVNFICHAEIVDMFYISRCICIQKPFSPPNWNEGTANSICPVNLAFKLQDDGTYTITETTEFQKEYGKRLAALQKD